LIILFAPSVILRLDFPLIVVLLFYKTGRSFEDRPAYLGGFIPTTPDTTN